MIWELWFEKSQCDKLFQTNKRNKLYYLINGFLNFINFLKFLNNSCAIITQFVIELSSQHCFMYKVGVFF